MIQVVAELVAGTCLDSPSPLRALVSSEYSNKHHHHLIIVMSIREREVVLFIQEGNRTPVSKAFFALSPHRMSLLSFFVLLCVSPCHRFSLATYLLSPLCTPCIIWYFQYKPSLS